MHKTAADGRLHLNTATLLLCDLGGRVQAVSAEAANGFAHSATGRKHFSEVFGSDSAIGRWLTEQFILARRRENYSFMSALTEGGDVITVRLDTLKQDGEVYGFAIHLAPGGNGAGGVLSEGDSVVTRQQWHDIKNHLGGLKLYATLLLRRLPEGEELGIVEKMLASINAMIDRLARIRRGE